MWVGFVSVPGPIHAYRNLVRPLVTKGADPRLTRPQEHGSIKFQLVDGCVANTKRVSSAIIWLGILARNAALCTAMAIIGCSDHIYVEQ